MPKVKTCKFDYKGAHFEGTLNVSSKGVFNIKRPGTQEDWPRHHMQLDGDKAEEVEKQWKQACRDLSDRTRIERDVIAVRFDSCIREGGKKNHFNDRDAMLILEVRRAIEVITEQGGKRSKAFLEHPDFEGWGLPNQPWPRRMMMDLHHLNRDREDIVICDYSPELEATLIRACLGIQAIVDMLHEVTRTPETLALAAAGLGLLPTPPPMEIPEPFHRDEEE